jgi:o-succinylbenzoate synthase
VGYDGESLEEMVAEIDKLTSASSSARAALESAALDLAARSEGVPLFALLSSREAGPPREIECNALVVGNRLDDLERSARAAVRDGFRTFKLKWGVADFDHDLARVAFLRELVGSEAKIRLDANQSMTPNDALRVIEQIACNDIEYVEQPLPATDLFAMTELRKKSPIPLAADESAVGEADALRVIDAAAADVIVIKPSAAGGPLASLRIARAARRAGLEVVVTSLLDSAVGVSTAHHVALAISREGLLPACGLATQDLFDCDVARLDPIVRGHFTLPTGAGLGIKVDEARLCDLTSGPILDLSA